MTQQQKSNVGWKNERTEEVGGTCSHIFMYRIPKKNHAALLGVQQKLGRIYKRHGMLGSKISQLGKTSIFEGFSSFEKELGAIPEEEEIWIEVDSYKDANEFARIVAEIGQDAEAGPLWGELSMITGARPIIMGEFSLLHSIA